MQIVKQKQQKNGIIKGVRSHWTDPGGAVGQSHRVRGVGAGPPQSSWMKRSLTVG